MTNEIKKAAVDYAQCQQPKTFSEQRQHVKDFAAGAGWAMRYQRWTLTEDKLPDTAGKYLVLIGDEIRIAVFVLADKGLPAEFLTICKVIAWCPIPEQLLNKPE